MDETRKDEARTTREKSRRGAGPATEERPGPDAVGTAEAAPVDAAGPDGPSAAQLQDRLQRAVAELENLRKRYERQLEAARRAERDRVTAAWLPVLDHLELALQHAQADPAAIVAGVSAVREQALAVMTGLGYQRVEDVGARFDPALHQAAQVVRDSAAEPNTVVSVLRPGYTAESALLRPAVVTVAGGRE